jgi:trehalose-6-phosphate synthase
MAAALTPVRKKWQALWVGWSGLPETPQNAPPIPPGLQGLHVNANDYIRYYNHVANGALWPAFHGFKPEHIFSETDWRAYAAVNQRFTQTIAANAGPDDLIWVHDFHLLLVPSFLRKQGLQHKIGLFLHIPFVQQTVMKLPHARTILNSLMHSDICGVQTERDAQQLTACLSKLFPKAKLPRIQAFPIGIDYQHYQTAHSQAAVRHHHEQIQKSTGGKYVVLSVSRLDYTKGIVMQLRAVEHAIRRGMKNVCYKLIVAPSRESIGSYQQLKTAIDEEVSRFQKKIPGVLDYQYRNADFSELCAWYIRADALLVTPLIDGMNLVAKEYLATKPENQDGAIILSAQAGAAAQLKQALLVDPYDEAAIAVALTKAQLMPAAERRSRTLAIRQNLRREDVFWWAETFIQALEAS